MEVIRREKELKRPFRNPVLTIGNFDGVHLGHQVIFKRVMETAREICTNAKAVLVIGTSGIVYPAAALPEIVRCAGGTIVEINPSSTALTNGGGTVTIPMGAVMGVKALYIRMKGMIGRNLSGK